MDILLYLGYLETLRSRLGSQPGVEYRKGKFAFAANGRSIANMDTDGFVKVGIRFLKIDGKLRQWTEINWTQLDSIL